VPLFQPRLSKHPFRVLTINDSVSGGLRTTGYISQPFGLPKRLPKAIPPW